MSAGEENTPPAGVETTVLSASRFPLDKRLDAFTDAYSEQVLPCRIQTMSDAPFWADMVCVDYGGVEVASLSGAPMRCEVERSDAERNSPGLMVDLTLAGRSLLHHGGREAAAGRGEATILHTQMPFVAIAPEPLETRSLLIPESLLRPAVGDISRLAGLTLTTDLPEMLLLPSYLSAIRQLGKDVEPALGAAISRHLSDLVVAAIARRLRKEDPTEGRGIRAARLAEVRRIVARDLSQTTLNAARVGHHLGVSERYVQKLVEETGTTFSAYVMEQRLAYAHRELTRRQMPVREIAWAAGFADASHFTRMFRRRFGETPTAVRGSMLPLIAAE